MFTKKGDAAVLAKLGDAAAPYREIGERLHRIIRKSAPSLEPIVRWGSLDTATEATIRALVTKAVG